MLLSFPPKVHRRHPVPARLFRRRGRRPARRSQRPKAVLPAPSSNRPDRTPRESRAGPGRGLDRQARTRHPSRCRRRSFRRRPSPVPLPRWVRSREKPARIGSDGGRASACLTPRTKSVGAATRDEPGERYCEGPATVNGGARAEMRPFGNGRSGWMAKVFWCGIRRSSR